MVFFESGPTSKPSGSGIAAFNKLFENTASPELKEHYAALETEENG